MLLVTPARFLLQQIKMSSVKNAFYALKSQISQLTVEIFKTSAVLHVSCASVILPTICVSTLCVCVRAYSTWFH